MRKVLFSVFTTFLISFTSPAQSSRIDSLENKIDSLIYSADFETAQRLTLTFLDTNELTEMEQIRVKMLYAEVIRSSARPRKAVFAFKDALKNLPDIPNKELYRSRIYMSIAGCYFDIPNYKLAADYARLSIEISPDTGFAKTGHAVNYLILGYYDFLNHNYSKSKSYYQEALNLYRNHGDTCDLPLVYTKMARVSNRLGLSKEAERILKKCEELNKHCRIRVYDILIYETKYAIHRENRDFEKALESFVVLDDMRGEIEYDEQQSKLTELELAYEEEIRKAEIKNLKRLNSKNKDVRRNQAMALAVAIVAVIGLTILSFLLFKSNLRRRGAMKELEKLNSELETKVAERTAYLEEANNNIRLQAESIADRNKRLTDFYHLVTHNLRAPITNMAMLVSFANDAKDKQEANEFMSRMRSVIESLNSTVDDLVEKVNAGDVLNDDFGLEPFNIALNRAEKGLTAELQATNAEIKVDFSDAPAVFYSGKLLTGIFHNLLSNSLKYSHPDRTPLIRVKTKGEDDFIVLSFSDNGLGIDMEKYGDKLFKEKGVIHDHPEAKGVGLYALRKQIIRTGGEIWAESTPGEGTTFFVRFRD